MAHEIEQENSSKLLRILAIPARFERATPRLGMLSSKPKDHILWVVFGKHSKPGIVMANRAQRIEQVRMERHRCRIGVWRWPVEDRWQNLRFEQGQDAELEGGLAKATIIEIVAVDSDSCS
ncbi:hypothetical protein [Sinorhizobium medicae]|uniref:hypothetical protein n=1 Tax=Sinorhizobium medicae TaxID=110321 RepID=UPI0013E3B2EC|nr:hypothetical protein [Sinorhizobium medicae]MDX0617527.1 hypothetical protein [Sinorhizobium medicae]MDX1090820.1 hypothetical protein [Sinorhizobium medicae]MDX1158986.1 hypothetical protein [Sinorhizobium medicae]